MLNPKAIEVISLVQKATANSLTGYTFFSIRNYTSKTSGETANHLINIGIDLNKAKQDDIDMLRNLDLVKAKANGEFKGELADLQEAKAELIVSLINPNEVRSDAQKDAYTVLANGIKVHNETGVLSVFGFAHSKHVIVEGTYKKVNSSAKTLAKKELQKLMKSSDYRMYNLTIGEGQTLKAKGETIEL